MFINDEEAGLVARDAIIPGEDISRLSVSDLEERKMILLAEITRIEAAMTARRAGFEAAESVFKAG